MTTSGSHDFLDAVDQAFGNAEPHLLHSVTVPDIVAQMTPDQRVDMLAHLSPDTFADFCERLAMKDFEVRTMRDAHATSIGLADRLQVKLTAALARARELEGRTRRHDELAKAAGCQCARCALIE